MRAYIYIYILNLAESNSYPRKVVAPIGSIIMAAVEIGATSQIIW